MDDVIVVDLDDNQIGTMPKSEAHEKGIPHRIAVTYVENGSGKILVQIRMSGALDHSSAGHVLPGESYLDAAKRELSEELGITDTELRKIGHSVSTDEKTHDGHTRVHVFDIFVCVAVPGKLQEDEVKGVYWANPQEVLEDMKSGKSRAEYAGGFRESLPVYISSR